MKQETAKPVTAPVSVLILGAHDEAAGLVEDAVAPGGVSLARAASAEEGSRLLLERAFDLVVIDASVASAALHDLSTLRSARPGLKAIVICSERAPEAVLESMREHAFAYFGRPFEPQAVQDAIASALGVPDWEDGIEVISARPQWISLCLRCRRSTVERVLGFLAEVRLDVPADEREHLAMAVREILLNAVEHGGQLDARKRVRITRLRTSRLVIYHVQDPGSGFSSDALPHAAVSNPDGDPLAHTRHRSEQGLRPGGFGILTARNLVDELMYSERGNEAVFIKHLEQPVPKPESL